MNFDVYDDDGLDDSRTADVTAHAALPVPTLLHHE